MCIIESKPDTVLPDLRLGKPWPELLQFADSISLDDCEDIVHKHTPYCAPSRCGGTACINRSRGLWTLFKQSLCGVVVGNVSTIAFQDGGSRYSSQYWTCRLCSPHSKAGVTAL
jgi:hypothetical protein